MKRDFVFEDSGFVLTLLGDVSYVLDNEQFLARGTNDSGFQHYDVGLIGTYSLNTLFNVSRRYGEFSVQGYLYYTDGIDNNLRRHASLGRRRDQPEVLTYSCDGEVASGSRET